MSDDLIKRLSAGERWGGDNAEVLRALGYSHRWVGGEVISTYKGDKLLVNRGLFPLSSVDDALRLVPEGWTVSLMQYSATKWAAALLSAGQTIETTSGTAPTAAIALTIAILEASRG